MSKAFHALEVRMMNEIFVLRSMVNLLLPLQYRQQQFLQQPQFTQPIPQFDSRQSVQPVLNNNQAIPNPSVPPYNRIKPNNKEASNYQADSTHADGFQPSSRPAAKDSTKSLFKYASTTEAPSYTTKSSSLSKLNLPSLLSSSSPFKYKSRFTSPISETSTEPTATTTNSPSERILEFRPVQKKSLYNNRSRIGQRYCILD